MLATTITHPLDLVKVRLQLCTDCTVRKIIRHDGIGTLYSGLSAALLRQATYTTTRLGVYTYFNDIYKTKFKKEPPLGSKVIIGTLSGVAGALVGTPSEVILVRMMADGPHYPCYCRGKYKGVVDAILQIVNNEGIRALWKGGTPTVVRSIIVSCTQLTTYNQSREMMLAAKMENGLMLHVYASVLASLATALLSLPADTIKTRSQFVGEKASHIRILRDIITNEGALQLWRGFPPYFYRLAMHTVLTFVFWEQMKLAYIHIFMEK